MSYFEQSRLLKTLYIANRCLRQRSRRCFKSNRRRWGGVSCEILQQKIPAKRRVEFNTGKTIKLGISALQVYLFSNIQQRKKNVWLQSWVLVHSGSTYWEENSQSRQIIVCWNGWIDHRRVTLVCVIGVLSTNTRQYTDQEQRIGMLILGPEQQQLSFVAEVGRWNATDCALNLLFMGITRVNGCNGPKSEGAMTRSLTCWV